MTSPAETFPANSANVLVDSVLAPIARAASLADFSAESKAFFSAKAPTASAPRPRTTGASFPSIGAIINGIEAIIAISAPGPPDIPYIMAPIPAMDAPPATLLLIPAKRSLRAAILSCFCSAFILAVSTLCLSTASACF